MMDDSVVGINASDDIKPYKIHVSSKYLELTKKKLELTRLPHEILLPKSKAWNQGTPKSEIEPLIDFWLERYSWRTQESEFNKSLPQFRTAVTIPSSSVPFRIHFTHVKSPHALALPLLLLPTFPLTNLSLEPLLKPLTHPDNADQDQPFHVVVPSIPGLGFSDAFNAIPDPESSVVEDTAHIFNALMLKLGYEYYIASSTGSGINSPADIDYQLPRILAFKHRNNCLGIHIIDPPVQPPVLSSSPINWTKFAIAKFFHAPIFGYTATDWAALKKKQTSSGASTRHGRHAAHDIEANPTINSSTPLLSRPPPSSLGLSGSSYNVGKLLGLREPNTLAYALCDSPVGLLSLVLNGLQRISPGHTFSSTEIINLTQLAWLPGPEGALRFWSNAAVEPGRKVSSWSATPTAVTVFLGNGGESDSDSDGEDSYTAGTGPYICPAWAGTRHNVIWSKRQEGRAGLIAWERKEAIIEGIRGLTEQVLQIDPRLAAKVLLDEVEEVEEEVVAAAVAFTAAAVVVAEEEAEEEELEGVAAVKGISGDSGKTGSNGGGKTNGNGNGGASKSGASGKNDGGQGSIDAGERVRVTEVGGKAGASGAEEEVAVEIEVESPDTVILQA